VTNHSASATSKRQIRLRKWPWSRKRSEQQQACDEDVHLIASSPLFDIKWYISQGAAGGFADDDRAGLAHHYLTVGAGAGLSPSPLFDGSWYTATYLDVAASGLDPFVHFLRVGLKAGRDPNPDFLSDWYRLFYPEVGRTNAIPIEHYTVSGRAEGRMASPITTTVSAAPTVQWAVAPAKLGGANLSYVPEQLDGGADYRGSMLDFTLPNGKFDEWTYLYHNGDVASAVAKGGLPSGEEHFLRCGRNEYRVGARKIPRTTRELSYLLRNPDVARMVREGQCRSGFEHWLNVGRREELSGLRQPFLSGASNDVGAYDLSSWEDGYVILPGLFSSQRCDRLVDLMTRLWRERDQLDLPISMDVFLDRADGNKNILVKNAPEDAYDHPYKINNLYFWSHDAREMVLDEQLCRVLRRLLGGDPAVMTSLNFRKGSQQGMHLDTFYMPPALPYRMVAAWIALEDVHEENGPLLYIPGTNRISPYYFEGHRLWTNNSPEEYQAFDSYFYRKIGQYGLKENKLLISKGDVLIWHSLLLHGGAKILNHDLTRFSMVAHYFVAADYPGGSSTNLPTTRLKTESFGRYYEDRWPQFQPLSRN
jgi:phytanoyl-CoA hydroxylase